MTITGSDGSPRYQVLDDMVVEIAANKDCWEASCSEYPDCVARGRTPEEALDTFAATIKEKKRHVDS